MQGPEAFPQVAVDGQPVGQKIGVLGGKPSLEHEGPQQQHHRDHDHQGSRQEREPPDPIAARHRRPGYRFVLRGLALRGGLHSPGDVPSTPGPSPATAIPRAGDGGGAPRSSLRRSTAHPARSSPTTTAEPASP